MFTSINSPSTRGLPFRRQPHVVKKFEQVTSVSVPLVGGVSVSIKGGGDAQASMRAMVQTRKHRELTVTLRQTSAVLGAISGIAGLLSTIPVLTPVCGPLALAAGILATGIDCFLNWATADCIVGAATLGVGKRLVALIKMGTPRFVGGFGLDSSLEQTARIGNFSLSGLELFRSRNSWNQSTWNP
jgi:hypothetical protein